MAYHSATADHVGIRLEALHVARWGHALVGHQPRSLLLVNV